MTEEQFEVLKNWIETRVALTIKANQNKCHSEIVSKCLRGIQAADQSAKSHLVTKT